MDHRVHNGQPVAHTPTPPPPMAFFLPALIVLSVTALVMIGTASGMWSYDEVLRDPAAQFGYPIYGGFVSYLGVAGWLISASATALTAAVRLDMARKLLPVAGLALLLAMDDLFMLHEALLPRIGIPETVVLALYALAAAVALFPYAGDILRWRRPLLAMSLIAMVASLGVDMVLPYDDGAALLLEDLLKFTGITLWTTCWSLHAIDVLRQSVQPKRPG